MAARTKPNDGYYKTAFARALKAELDDRRDLSVTSFAEAVGVSRDQVHAWLRGESFPEIPTIIRIEEALFGESTGWSFRAAGLVASADLLERLEDVLRAQPGITRGQAEMLMNMLRPLLGAG